MKNLKNLTRRPFSSGFTLIELLIVMVIITVLATIGLVSYQRAVTNAKNAKAISDMKAYQAGLEQAYLKNNGRYTTAAGGTTCDKSSMEVATLQAPAGLSYQGPFCDDNTYCACATLTSGATVGNAGGTTANSTCPALGTSGAYFCVKNRQ